jgi:hypothetical protein
MGHKRNLSGFPELIQQKIFQPDITSHNYKPHRFAVVVAPNNREIAVGVQPLSRDLPLKPWKWSKSTVGVVVRSTATGCRLLHTDFIGYGCSGLTHVNCRSRKDEFSS